MLSADYSQIELRVLAHLSGDPTLIDAFRRGEDIHARTAAEVLGRKPEEVDAEARRLAKVINFGIIYGMGPQRLAGELGISLKEASEYIKRYFERLPGVHAYLEESLAAGARAGMGGHDVRAATLSAGAELATGRCAGAGGANRDQHAASGDGRRPDQIGDDPPGRGD